MEQLQLFDNSQILDTDNHSNWGFTDWEVDTEENVFCNPPESIQNETSEDSNKLFCNPTKLTEKAVTEYQPKGSAGGNKKYFRFSYKRNRKTKHLHIKGGNTESQLALRRKSLVEAWIREDVPLEKIIAWIKEW